MLTPEERAEFRRWLNTSNPPERRNRHQHLLSIVDGFNEFESRRDAWWMIGEIEDSLLADVLVEKSSTREKLAKARELRAVFQHFGKRRALKRALAYLEERELLK